MATIEDIEAALRAADKAAQSGNAQAAQDAKRLAEEYTRMKGAPKADPSKVASDRVSAAKGLADFTAPPAARKLAQEATHLASTGEIDEKFDSDINKIDRKGLPFFEASDILSADNEAELQKEAKGQGGTLKRDYSGRQYLQYGDGRKVYVQPQGAGGHIKRLGEELAARPGEVGGSTVGGMFGGPGGAAGGGAIGYVLDQAIKASRRRYAKTTGELALGGAESAAMNAGGEAVARVPGAIMRGGLPRWLTGATDETIDLSRRLDKKGGALRYSAASPGLASPEFKVQRAEKLGVPANANQTKATIELIKDFFKKHNISDAEGTVGAAKTGPLGRRLENEGTQYGEGLLGKPKSLRATLEDKVKQREAQVKILDQGISTARQVAEQDIKALAGDLGTGSNNFRQVTNDAVAAAKASRSAKAAANYEKVAATEGDLAVDMTGVGGLAAKILGELPRNAKGGIMLADPQSAAPALKFLRDLSTFSAGTNQQMPIANAAKLRTQLNRLLSKADFLPNTKIHLVGQLEEAFDGAIKSASGTNKAAAAARDKAETEYALDSRRIDQALIKRLSKQAKQTGSVDNSAVIPLIVRDPEKFEGVWGLLNPEARRRVARGAFDSMLTKATTQEGRVDGRALLSQLKKYPAQAKAMFGDKLPKMYEAATALAKLDGHIPLDTMKGPLLPENVIQALEVAAKTQEKMDGFLQNHALAALAPGTDPGNAAVADAKAEVARMAADRAKAKAAGGASAGEARGASRDRVIEAGNRVGATPEKRIEIGRQKVQDAKAQLQEFDATHFGKMADPNFLREAAVDHILQPGNDSLLEKALQLYGEDSPQFKGLQEAFFKKALAHGTQDLSDKKSPFAGQGIRDFLARFSKKQKDALLKPYGMTMELDVGPRWKKAKPLVLTGEEVLQKLARDYDTIFPRARTTAAFAAGEQAGAVSPTNVLSTKGRLTLLKYGQSLVTGYLLKHPAAVKLLVTGFDHGPKAQAAIATLDNLLRAEIQTSASQVKPMGSPQ